MNKKNILSVAMIFICFSAAAETTKDLPMDRVYQGKVRLPDFSGRDRSYSNYKTKITNEMQTGPNFAGHYAIVEIGCGTSCRFAFVGDVSTGKVFDFPYGGENYYQLSLEYGVKNNNVSARWIEGDSCIHDYIEWDGKKFTSMGKNKIGSRERCE